MQIHFTDAKVKARSSCPPASRRSIISRRSSPGRSLILTLNAGGRHGWSVLVLRAGQPKRRKLG